MPEVLAEVDIKAMKVVRQMAIFSAKRTLISIYADITVLQHSVTVPPAAQTTEESLLMMVAERIAPKELVALMKAVEDEAPEENVKWTDIVALLEGKLLISLL